MKFGERVRVLRQQRQLTQQKLAVQLGVSVGYISKVETERLQFGDYPSEKFIHKLAEALEADEDELLLLTERVPVAIRKRVLERPDVFGPLAQLDDRSLDSVLLHVQETGTAVGKKLPASSERRRN